MPKKIEIDTEKLKALHAQGLTDGAIGERLGVSAGTIFLRRNQLGLPAGHRGPGRGPGVKSARAAQPAMAGKRSEIASAGGDFQRRGKAGTPMKLIGATIHLSPAGLDRLWNALSLEMKAHCINKILSN